MTNNQILFSWDFHGVLEKGNEYSVQALCNLVLKEFGQNRQMTLAETINWYGLSWYDYFKLLAPKGDQKLWKDMVKRTFSFQDKGWKIIKNNLKPREFAKEVLSTIKKEGHANILLSNTHPTHIRPFTDLLDLTKYFDHIIGVDTHRESRLGKEIDSVKTQVLYNFLKGKNYQKKSHDRR